MQDEVLNARPNATLGTIRNEDWKVMVNLKDPGGPNGQINHGKTNLNNSDNANRQVRCHSFQHLLKMQQHTTAIRNG